MLSGDIGSDSFNDNGMRYYLWYPLPMAIMGYFQFYSEYLSILLRVLMNKFFFWIKNLTVFAYNLRFGVNSFVIFIPKSCEFSILQIQPTKGLKDLSRFRDFNLFGEINWKSSIATKF